MQSSVYYLEFLKILKLRLYFLIPINKGKSCIAPVFLVV